jgi:putative ABC transport system permease protein
MWKILLEEFIGDLKVQKTRAFLTMFAITWGTIAVVLLLAFGEGLKIAVVEGTLNARERVLSVWGGSTSLTYEGLPKGRRIRLTERDLELLRQSIVDIDIVSPSYGRGGATIRYGDVRTTSYMEGVYPAFSEMRRMYPVAGGRFLNLRDVEERRRVVFLGSAIAERLFGDVDPIGESIELDGLPFTLVGVMESKFQTSMNNGPDEDRIVIPASTMKTIYGHQQVNHLLIRPRDVSRSSHVKRQIFEIMGRRYQFDPDDEEALSIWDSLEEERITRAIGLGIQIFLGLVGGFTLIIAGVGVANIMYVVVRERTHEIGIKMAMGARRLHVMSQFVFEALMIAFIGGAVGLAVAATVVVVVDRIPTDGNMAMEFIANPTLSWPIALTCVSVLVMIGLAAGILPARKAARLDPVESLRYE